MPVVIDDDTTRAEWGGAGRTVPDGLAGSRALVRAGVLVRRHSIVLAILALYALAAAAVPTMAPVPIGDDWVYKRSVEILFDEGRVRILDLTVVTLLFQIAWGGLFSLLLGPTFGALRLSTVVLVLFSSLALYGLCRELGVGRVGSGLGMATYLFNPLAFVLSFTFMSDPQLTALLVIGTYCYARGLRPGAADARLILAGSFFAACAFLVRQQGAFLPLAVGTYLVASRRLPPNRLGIRILAQVVTLPVLAVVGYYAWLRFVHGVPYWQTKFSQEMADAGWSGAWSLTRLLAFVIAMYLGFFVLPVALAALGRMRQLARANAVVGWSWLGAWATLLGVGMIAFGVQGRFMPYVPQFFNVSGLGPLDLAGNRPALFGPAALICLTVLCAAASLCLILGLGRQIKGTSTPQRSVAGLVLAVLLWQIAGIVPPSIHFLLLRWAGSLDRYLLPLLPFTICLALWALHRTQPFWPAAWAIVAVLALFAVTGTRDHLVFQQATWDLARQANGLGVPNARLDAGASWNGYHLYDDPFVEYDVPQSLWDRPWWISLFTPTIDPSYVVASEPLPRHTVVRRVEYSAWLHREPVYLYLLRRPGVFGPP